PTGAAGNRVAEHTIFDELLEYRAETAEFVGADRVCVLKNHYSAVGLRDEARLRPPPALRRIGRADQTGRGDLRRRCLVAAGVQRASSEADQLLALSWRAYDDRVKTT